MKKLPVGVRNKAIEISNALLEEKMDEGIAIATGISRAKDWAANRGKPTKSKSADSKSKDVKKHGQDLYVTPSKSGWAVKSEKSSRKENFSTKKEAVQTATKRARKANASITVKDSHGKIKTRTSYNPNRRAPKQK